MQTLSNIKDWVMSMQVLSSKLKIATGVVLYAAPSYIWVNTVHKNTHNMHSNLSDLTNATNIYSNL